MLVSELIEALQAVLATKGDLTVALKETETFNGSYISVYEPLEKGRLFTKALSSQRRPGWPFDRWDSAYPAGDHLVIDAS